MGLLRAGHYFVEAGGVAAAAAFARRGVVIVHLIPGVWRRWRRPHVVNLAEWVRWQAIADLIQRVVVVGRVLLIMGRVFFFVVLLAVVLSGYSTYNKRRDVEIKRLKWRGERGKAERRELAAAACLGVFSELGGRNIAEDVRSDPRDTTRQA
jgi:hypothetical protein